MNVEITRKILERVDAEKDGMIKDLSDLITIPSVSDDKKHVAEALNHMLKLGETYDFVTQSKAHDRVGVIEMGNGDETLGILTHVDVVPPGPLDLWTTPPFQADIRDGKIFGRGTLDDKGMVIASLYAMKIVREMGLPLKKKVQLIIGTQEETAWDDMFDYVKNNKLPDYGFTPDGEFPIENIEKGVCDLVLEFDTPKANNEDGEKPYIVSINAGTASNCVPARAEAVLSNGEIIIAEGRAAHSSVPSRGVNAIFELRNKLISRKVESNIFTKILDVIYFETSDFVGKNMPFYKEDEYYKGEYVHRNVFIPTIFKTENGKLSILVDIRYVIGTEIQEVKDYFEKIAKQFGGLLRVSDDLPPVFVSREKPFLKSFAEAYEYVTGKESEFLTGYGASYAKTMHDIVGWGPVFPGEQDTCHEANEFISIDSLINCTKIYATAIAEIVLSDKSYK